MRSLILCIQIMTLPNNGWATTIPIRSMHFRSNTPSVASQIAATLPRRASPRKSIPPPPDHREQTRRGPHRTVTAQAGQAGKDSSKSNDNPLVTKPEQHVELVVPRESSGGKSCRPPKSRDRAEVGGQGGPPSPPMAPETPRRLTGAFWWRVAPPPSQRGREGPLSDSPTSLARPHAVGT